MANEALLYPVYKPAVRTIIGITNAKEALITTGILTFPANVVTATATDHGYLAEAPDYKKCGILVRFSIPSSFGMQDIPKSVPQRLYKITEIVSSSSFTIDLDTTHYDAFVIPTVVYITSPVTGWPVPLPPYRFLDGGLKLPALTGQLIIDQVPQVIPHGYRADVLINELKNVLPYP